MQNKKRYLIAGFIGAAAVLLASAGASAHLGSSRPLSDQLPTPTASGAASVSAADEVEAPSVEPTETPETASTPEPAETPEAAPTPEPTETPEAAKTPEPAETPDVETTAAVGSNSEQDGDHQGGSGGGDSGD
jgi:outer membrane biosynthesis protein TonB